MSVSCDGWCDGWCDGVSDETKQTMGEVMEYYIASSDIDGVGC